MAPAATAAARTVTVGMEASLYAGNVASTKEQSITIFATILQLPPPLHLTISPKVVAVATVAKATRIANMVATILVKNAASMWALSCTSVATCLTQISNYLNKYSLQLFQNDRNDVILKLTYFVKCRRVN